MTSPATSLATPFSVGSLTMANRIVMAPMTRCRSTGGVPGPDVADYYGRRAAAGVGLILSEGTLIPHIGAQNDPAVPRFYGADALSGWSAVLDAVHRAGGRMFPQIWHPGLIETPQVPHLYARRLTPEHYPIPLPSPSGLLNRGIYAGQPMTDAEVSDVIQAFGEAAATAYRLGFDGIEIHGAHGYLIDQFLWGATNERKDIYGGDAVDRTRFACEVIAECRRRLPSHFPISFRFSQWKQQDYETLLGSTVAELEALLTPLADAGADIFHCSTRRFWDAEFSDSPLNLAEWTKKLTGRATITVGSIAIDGDLLTRETHRRQLERMLDQGLIDLVAVGRAMVAAPEAVMDFLGGGNAAIPAYEHAMLAALD